MILCACGCGEATAIAKRTDSRRGHVKGEPMRFVSGHNSLVPAAEIVAAPVMATLGEREIAEGDILLLRGIDDADAAEVYDYRVRHLESSYRRTFVELGLICSEMSDRSLWSKLFDPVTGVAYHSFDAWLLAAAGASRSSAYSAMKVVRDLGALPVADLREMPRCNAVTLARLSTAVQTSPEIIAAAKELSEEAFIAKVSEKHPNQHIESREKLVVKPDKSARGVIDLALSAAGWVYGEQSREGQLEALASYFLDGPCESADGQSQTNRIAYSAALARGEV